MISQSSPTDKSFLSPPPGKQYVRSFIFSRHIYAPLAQVHLLARIIFVFCLSAALLRTINTGQPDLVGASILALIALALFICSGMKTRIATIYILLTLPALFILFATWALLSTLPGVTVLHQAIYDGQMHLGLAVWELIWLAIVIGYYWWRRALLTGFLLASLVAILFANLVPTPALPLVSFSFWHPLVLNVTGGGLYLALTKAIGYFGMIVSTIALVMTSRDIELIGCLLQLGVPQPVIFFLCTVFRALNLAITDFEIIHQAQVARAINARPRSFLRRLSDLGSIAVPMIAIMLRRSNEIGDALVARGYKLGQNQPDYYETSPWRLIDWILLLASLLLLYLALFPHPTLTALVVTTPHGTSQMLLEQHGIVVPIPRY